VKVRPDLAGKQKCSANPHGADGIQLIGIKQDLGFERLGDAFPAEPMRPDAVANRGDLPFIKKIFLQYPSGQASSSPGMANLSVRLILLVSSDIVEDSGKPQYIEVRLLLAADAQAESIDPFCMVPSVASASANEAAFGVRFDFLEKAFAEPGYFGNFSVAGHLLSGFII